MTRSLSCSDISRGSLVLPESSGAPLQALHTLWPVSPATLPILRCLLLETPAPLLQTPIHSPAQSGAGSLPLPCPHGLGVSSCLSRPLNTDSITQVVFPQALWSSVRDPLCQFDHLPRRPETQPAGSAAALWLSHLHPTSPNRPQCRNQCSSPLLYPGHLLAVPCPSTTSYKA